MNTFFAVWWKLNIVAVVGEVFKLITCEQLHVNNNKRWQVNKDRWACDATPSIVNIIAEMSKFWIKLFESH